MRLGIDFDNTIVSYDTLFFRMAAERGLVPTDLPATKSAVRDYLRCAGNEEAWTEMQGTAYGPQLRDAQPFPGVLDFFQACRAAGISVCIISHKTRHPFRGPPHDLHDAAIHWLELHGFFDPARIGLPRDQVFFEVTKSAKLERIRQEGCTHFIDDLPEFLEEPAFPRQVLRLLFDPHDLYPGETRFVRVQTWDEIRTLFCVRPEVAANVTTLRELALPLIQAQGVSGNVLLQPITGGANNRVFRLRGEGVDRVLKVFYSHPDDPRDRFRAERAFYSHLWRSGVRCIPEPCGWDEANRLGLLGFIAGRKLQPDEVTADAVHQAVEFVLAANQRRAEVLPDEMPLAAEACFSVAEHVALVDRRVSRLEQIVPETELDAEAADFLRDDLRPAWAQVRARLLMGAGEETSLEQSRRCLSPSDFGFHNALLSADGQLMFFDFEYAGWDDPAKLICDFFCQPQLPVNLSAWDQFVDPLDHFLAGDGSLTHRARLLLPAYQLKWCCILLNDFLPLDHARRQFALGPDAMAERKRLQLTRAHNTLARACSGFYNHVTAPPHRRGL
jgi:hypothetical protein